MKHYFGDRTIDGIVVTVDGAPLDARVDVVAYTDQGFEWSYDGAEPQQLSFALLLDHFGVEQAERAMSVSKAFAQQVVARFDNTWELTSQDIDSALAAIGA